MKILRENRVCPIGFILKKMPGKQVKLIFFTLFLISLALTSLKGQNALKTDFFVQENDTIYCVHIQYFSNDTCELIKWFDLEGKSKVIRCIQDAGITSFSINKRVYDLITTKNGKKSFYWKKIDGRIKMYVKDFTETIWYNQNMPETETMKYISVQQGEYLKIKGKRDIKRILLPIFVNCEGFRSGYYGKFAIEELDNMIKVFNSNCNLK